MKKNPHRPVLIAAFGPPALAILRSWRDLFHHPAIIWFTEKGVDPARYRLIDTQMSIRPDEFFTEQGIRVVSSFLSDITADSITCINERTALHLQNNLDLLPPQIRIFSSGAAVTVALLCKETQVKTAEKVGLTVLPTYYLGRQTCKKMPDVPAASFPLCLRPSEPGAVCPGFKVEIVHSPAEFESFLSNHSIEKGHIIAQPFRQLPNLVVHGSRSIMGKPIGLQGFLVERKFEGITLTIRPMKLDPVLKSLCIHFTDEFNLVGNYHFEFLYEPETGEAFFLEINARFGGTTAKVAASGYIEPVYTLMAHGIILPHTNGKLGKRTISSKTAQIKYLYDTIYNKINALDYPDEPKAIRLLKTLWGLFYYSDDIFSWRDLRGSWALYYHNIRTKLKKQY